ncbi:MAG TPA: hypothetical protein VF137_09355 [Candidatus Dormibacteraeota bacterium]
MHLTSLLAAPLALSTTHTVELIIIIVVVVVAAFLFFRSRGNAS